MVQWDGHTVLIDTTPDFREQAIREAIRKIDAVLYTHGHADHILGLDDVRPLSFPRVTGGGKIPLYASDAHGAGPAQRLPLHLRGGLQVRRSGASGVAAGQRAGGSVWSNLHAAGGASRRRSDRSAIASARPPISPTSAASRRSRWRSWKGWTSCFSMRLRHHPHPTHSTVENSLKLVERLKPKRAFFTHISHDLPHEETNAALPDNVRLAHDGLKLEFEL